MLGTNLHKVELTILCEHVVNGRNDLWMVAKVIISCLSPQFQFKIGLCQLPVTADQERNIRHARKSIEEAAEKGAKLVLLPRQHYLPSGKTLLPVYVRRLFSLRLSRIVNCVGVMFTSVSDDADHPPVFVILFANYSTMAKLDHSNIGIISQRCTRKQVG
ncbi:hypothetical protein LguiA_020138 [Lonicera macranthoides]